MIGNGGKELVDWAQRKGWYILNGKEIGTGNILIYVDYRVSTVIDYVIANESIRENVRKFAIGDRETQITCRCYLAWKEKRRGRRQRKRNKSKK